MKISQNYKTILKAKIQDKKQGNPRFNSKWLAQQLDIQYTYLSKVFNQDGFHFSSEHLYSMCLLLKLDQEETDLVMLLRDYEVSQDSKHKEYVLRKIQGMGESYAVGPEVKTKHDTNAEMEYLFDPTAVLIHVGLSIKAYKNNPLLFCDKLNLTINELKAKLKLLSRVGFLDLDEDNVHVTKLHQHKIHFGKNHPLMRVHQMVFKNKINSTLLDLKESEKESFMATFSFDEESFDEAKAEFKVFFNKLVKIQGKSTQNKLFQLNFDLFKWF